MKRKDPALSAGPFRYIMGKMIGDDGMPGYLIQDTTEEERRAIVEESLGNLNGACDGCMTGLAEMYNDYIAGKKEIREINEEFNARFVRDMEREDHNSCVM